MSRTILSIRSVLFIVFTLAYSSTCAPVQEKLPSSFDGNKVSHITKGDVELLKEKLKELEEDLNQLEPVIPDETVVEDEVDDEVEPVEDETDEAEDEVEGETAPVADKIIPAESGVQNEEEVEIDFEEEPAVDEGIITVDEPVVEEEEEEDGGWEDGEFVPYRDPEEEDLYLRKLILKALTVLYRKDVDRIDRMLWRYYHNMAEGDEIFPENAKPIPEDLRPNPDDLEVEELDREVEGGTFVDMPFNDNELQSHDALVAMAAEQRRELDIAEETLEADIQAIQDQGISLDDILADLEDQERAEQREGRSEQLPAERPASNQQNEKLEEEAIKEEIASQITHDVEKTNNRPIAEKKPRGNNGGNLDGLNNEVDAEGDARNGENAEAEELLAELMANLNTSLQKYEEQKGQGGRNE